MTSLDTGTYGAKIQSWRNANPRELLKRIMDANPKSGKDSLHELFRDEVLSKAHSAMLDSIIEYWFANNYHSLIERSAPEERKRKAQLRSEIERIKEKIRANLLDMVMPNGTALRHCTFGYCAKLGGGLARIGKAGKPNQIVGAHLSEAEIKKLLG